MARDLSGSERADLNTGVFDGAAPSASKGRKAPSNGPIAPEGPTRWPRASGWKTTCVGFLRKFGLQDEIKLNIEQEHAILTGHSFEHELALAYHQVLRMGGFPTSGTSFDAKLRRQSLDLVGLIAAHLGGMDINARGPKAAATMLEDG